jgi:putative LysE/RhtB family amino acid efflux pump
MTSAFPTGFALGFVVAAQVGPIWVFCARSVLRGNARVGIAIGAGAAVVDALYAGLGLAGASAILEIDPVRIGFGLVGAGFLAFLGLRTLWSAFRVRLGGETEEEVSSPRRAFLTSLAATASNPATIAAWAAVFAAAATADLVDTGWSAASLVVGVALGTLTWFTILSTGLSLTRHRIGPRLLMAVDAISGLVLLGFATLLAVKTLDETA